MCVCVCVHVHVCACVHCMGNKLSSYINTTYLFYILYNTGLSWINFALKQKLMSTGTIIHTT